MSQGALREGARAGGGRAGNTGCCDPKRSLGAACFSKEAVSSVLEPKTLAASPAGAEGSGRER